MKSFYSLLLLIGFQLGFMSSSYAHDWQINRSQAGTASLELVTYASEQWDVSSADSKPLPRLVVSCLRNADMGRPRWALWFELGKGLLNSTEETMLLITLDQKTEQLFRFGNSSNQSATGLWNEATARVLFSDLLKSKTLKFKIQYSSQQTSQQMSFSVEGLERAIKEQNINSICPLTVFQ